MSEQYNHKAFNSEKAEAFSERLLSALNDGALCLMTSIGHRTGLFDAMRDRSPMTVEEIAQSAGLENRYVREWLGAMVTSGVIEVDPDSTRFVLPSEHAAFLTRAANADNFAVFAQYIAVLGRVEDEIVDCFTKGGGVPYEKFLRFHSVMAEDSGQSVLSSLESHILPLVPGLSKLLARGIRILDIGCGSGRIINRLAGDYPNSMFTGMDLSAEAIGAARKKAGEKNLKNTEFIVCDLSNFDETADPGTFDFITAFDAIHDQARPFNVLKGIFPCVKTRWILFNAGHQGIQPCLQ